MRRRPPTPGRRCLPRKARVPAAPGTDAGARHRPGEWRRGQAPLRELVPKPGAAPGTGRHRAADHRSSARRWPLAMRSACEPRTPPAARPSPGPATDGARLGSPAVPGPGSADRSPPLSPSEELLPSARRLSSSTWCQARTATSGQPCQWQPGLGPHLATSIVLCCTPTPCGNAVTRDPFVVMTGNAVTRDNGSVLTQEGVITGVWKQSCRHAAIAHAFHTCCTIHILFYATACHLPVVSVHVGHRYRAKTSLGHRQQSTDLYLKPQPKILSHDLPKLAMKSR